MTKEELHALLFEFYGVPYLVYTRLPNEEQRQGFREAVRWFEGLFDKAESEVLGATLELVSNTIWANNPRPRGPTLMAVGEEFFRMQEAFQAAMKTAVSP